MLGCGAPRLLFRALARLLTRFHRGANPRQELFSLPLLYWRTGLRQANCVRVEVFQLFVGQIRDPLINPSHNYTVWMLVAESRP